MRTRPMAVAGQFYPAEPGKLDREIGHFLSQQVAPLPEKPRMLIVPHAGYIYSGAIAARAFQLASRFHYDSVVLLGPAHTVPLRGIASCNWEAFATPLGSVAIDVGKLNNVRDSEHVHPSNQAHAQEHSLEVQLPFLRATQPETPIVPLVVGAIGAERLSAVLDRLIDDNTLLVISTDLSHFLNQDQANRRDHRTIDKVLALETDLTGDQACGAYPLNGALSWAKAKGLTPQLLSYDTSARASGDKHRVVGYASFAIH